MRLIQRRESNRAGFQSATAQRIAGTVRPSRGTDSRMAHMSYSVQKYKEIQRAICSMCLFLTALTGSLPIRHARLMG